MKGLFNAFTNITRKNGNTCCSFYTRRSAS
ncbi:AgrD family cyclic lactone autoinducer peptide [Proteus columbae]